jgi:hypothetical protein
MSLDDDAVVIIDWQGETVVRVSQSITMPVQSSRSGMSLGNDTPFSSVKAADARQHGAYAQHSTNCPCHMRPSLSLSLSLSAATGSRRKVAGSIPTVGTSRAGCRRGHSRRRPAREAPARPAPFGPAGPCLPEDASSNSEPRRAAPLARLCRQVARAERRRPQRRGGAAAALARGAAASSPWSVR